MTTSTTTKNPNLSFSFLDSVDIYMSTWHVAFPSSISQQQTRCWLALLGPCTSELDPVIFGVSPEMFEQSQMLTGILQVMMNPALTVQVGLVEPYPHLETRPCIHAERGTGFPFHHGCCWGWQYLFARGESTSMWLYSKSSVWIWPHLQ